MTPSAGPSDSLSPGPPRLLITAGPTHEPIDRVRYLANRSSGRMGLALTEAAIERGWPITLLLGPTPLQPPDSSHVKVQRFQTTAELEQMLIKHWPNHDVLIMAAAVADFRPKQSASESGKMEKIKRRESGLILELEPTPDLVAGLVKRTRTDQHIIGFALEPAKHLADRALEKLHRKGLDAIVANPLETMGAADVAASLFLPDGRCISPARRLTKEQFATWLLDQVRELNPRSV